MVLCLRQSAALRDDNSVLVNNAESSDHATVAADLGAGHPIFAAVEV